MTLQAWHAPSQTVFMETWVLEARVCNWALCDIQSLTLGLGWRVTEEMINTATEGKLLFMIAV